MGASLMDTIPANPRRSGFTIAGAENLLLSLAGVVSARVVATPRGDVQEIHLLTTEEATPKQTVRNVESALLAHFDMSLDHRKISVAQTFDQRRAHTRAVEAQELEVAGAPAPVAEPAVLPPPAAAPAPVAARPVREEPVHAVEVPAPEQPAPPQVETPAAVAAPAPIEVEAPAAPAATAPAPQPTATPALAAAQAEPRIMFVAFQAESRHVQQVRLQVELEWKGETYRGQATGADLVRPRMETAAAACLKAVEAIAQANGLSAGADLAVSLDGVKTVDAFDRRFALVAVHAIVRGHLTTLTGSAAIHDSPDKAVILATLQATDRWVRGRV
jgi:hypothetical protein